MKEALGFLMTREVSHQQSFEKALYSIQPNFPPGKLPGMKQYSNVYFNMSKGGGAADMRGPWNSDANFDYQEATPAVDGGSGDGEVKLSSVEATALDQLVQRTQSARDADPTTGAELGAQGMPAK